MTPPDERVVRVEVSLSAAERLVRVCEQAVHQEIEVAGDLTQEAIDLTWLAEKFRAALAGNQEEARGR